MMKKKYLISQEIDKEKNERKRLTVLIREFNEAVELSKAITKGKIKKLDKEALDTFFNKQTGFLNGEMSAYAFNLKEEYQTVVKAIERLYLIKDETHCTINSTTGLYEVNEKTLTGAFAAYIPKDYQDEYDAVEVILGVIKDADISMNLLIETVNRDSNDVDKRRFVIACNRRRMSF